MDENIGLFDLDGSLADYEGQLMADLRRMHSHWEPPLPESPFEAEKLPWLKARMELIKAQPGWWANLPVMDAGKRVLELARTIGFDCSVLTKGPRRHALAWKEKLEWSFQNLGEIEVTITFNKSNTYGKFLYDDYPEFCYGWLANRPRGLVIMPVKKITPEHNHPRIVQYDGNNFVEVHQALQICYDRRANEPLILR